MAKIFIDRPVFAMVIAIVIVIIGAVAVPGLPVASYPEVVPPVVQITATYLGGNSQDLEKTVSQPIEEQLVGLDGMLYYQSNSANNGQLTISVTFKLGTDPDIAAVQTQNRVNIALPRLPQEVQQQGVQVRKVSSAFLMAIAVVATDNRYDSLFLTNYAQINLVNQIGSLQGVGESRLGSNQVYSMRIWVDPDKMTQLGVTSADIQNAISSQNRQNPAGALGQAPSPNGTDFQYTVNAPGRLVDATQFEDIIIRAQPDASLLRIKDIGRVELGAQNYGGFSRMDGRPSGNVIVYLSPGANATQTADEVKAFVAEAKKRFPAGIDYVIPYDSTVFVREAITDVIKTLLIAILLVIIVVYIFLQSWRATLIPLLTVPVAVVGTFALFPILGFSINITSMFGLVLAIGIVVDDAIVVVEAVQRHIDEGMSPRDATVQAMNEVSGPVIAIALILAAVFIPVAFIGGLSGQIYQQFALTIAVSVLISAFSALSLSPALCSLILKPKPEKHSEGFIQKLFDGFNRGFGWVNEKYTNSVRILARRFVFVLVGLAAAIFVAGFLFQTLPKGFLPDEDQGAYFVAMRLPDGASLERADAASNKIEKLLSDIEGSQHVFTLGGLDLTTQTSGSNVATIIVSLDPWEERTSKQSQLTALLGEAQMKFFTVPEAFTFAFGLPPILGLSTTGGFQFMLEDRGDTDIPALARAADALTNAARQRPELTNVISTFRPEVPSYTIKMNLDKLQTLGIPVQDAYAALQTFLGGLYVNDFNVFGRTWQVLVQAEQKYRSAPSDIDRFYVRTGNGSMVPLGTLATIDATVGPEVIYRYNRYRAVQILGGPAPGYSSGEANNVMEELAKTVLPAGFDFEWTGTTYQEKESQGNELAIFGFAAILVFLFLAALYESWTIPFAVILSLPLGLMGALVAIWLRSYPYDIYTQIGIVTLIGLAAKNAILIVEFAKEARDHGKSIIDAALEAAQVRLRPILMTSFAFILGVVPLAIATGASSGARRALGTTVVGGMLAATLLAIFVVPVLYFIIESLVERRKPSEVAEDTGSQPSPEPAR